MSCVINNLGDLFTGFSCACSHAVSVRTHTYPTKNRELQLGTENWELGTERRGEVMSLSLGFNARLSRSGVTACGVLWVEPGDPMTRRPSSIVPNLALLPAHFCDRRHSSS
jgi:hypothetical protein